MTLLGQKQEGELPAEWSERFERLAPGALATYKRVYDAAGGAVRRAGVHGGGRGAGRPAAFSAPRRSTTMRWATGSRSSTAARSIVIVDACMSGGLTPSGGTPDKGLKGGRSAPGGRVRLPDERVRPAQGPGPALAHRADGLPIGGGDAHGIVEGSTTACSPAHSRCSSRKAPGRSTCARFQGLLTRSPNARRTSTAINARPCQPEQKKPFPPFEPHLFTTDDPAGLPQAGPLTRSVTILSRSWTQEPPEDKSDASPDHPPRRHRRHPSVRRPGRPALRASRRGRGRRANRRRTAASGPS